MEIVYPKSHRHFCQIWMIRLRQRNATKTFHRTEACTQRDQRGVTPVDHLNWCEWGTQRGLIIGVLSWLVRWACRAGTREFCSALAVLVGPVQNIIFFTVHYSISIPFSPLPSKLGRQPCWVACLFVCVSARTLPMNALWPRVTQVAARASVASLKK